MHSLKDEFFLTVNDVCNTIVKSCKKKFSGLAEIFLGNMVNFMKINLVAVTKSKVRILLRLPTETLLAHSIEIGKVGYVKLA